MLTISEAQLQAVESKQRRRYATTLRELIERELRLDVSHEQVSALIGRAQRAGLTSERDVAGFVMIVVALAAGAPDLPTDWIEQRLNDPFANVSGRVEQAVKAAAQILQARG